MNIWIQSLSWTLILSLGQGALVFSTLWLVLKCTQAASAVLRYRLSLAALTSLLFWFGYTWWHQFHILSAVQSVPVTNVTVVPVTFYPTHITSWLFSLSSLKFSVYPISKWISLFYLTGFIIMTVRLTIGIPRLVDFRNEGTTPPPPHLQELLHTLLARMQWQAPVRLLLSVKATVPMVVGFLKPTILLPVATAAQLSTAQLEAILLHELAHLRRYDYIVNILQAIAETILFFNPFTWGISAICRREREYCCDDMVVRYTRQPMTYALALTAIARTPATTPPLAVAATGQSTQLFHRIKRIMEMKNKPFSPGSFVAALLIIAAAAGSVAFLPPAYTYTGKGDDNIHTSTSATTTAAPATDEQKLVGRLLQDGLVDQINGFEVITDDGALYINGRHQDDAVAGRYMSDIKKSSMRIKVFPFNERMRMHPKAGFIQLLLPVSFESPCVDTKPKKDGC